MNKNYLFVYGTLMQNHNNPYSKLIRENAEFIGKGFIYAEKFDFGDYPGIKIDPSKTIKTYGEVFKITSNLNLVLKELDFYEGYFPNRIYESLFIRKQVLVYADSSEIIAWVYEYNFKNQP